MRLLSCGAAIDDHAAEIPQTTGALVGVFAAQHLEHGIHAFSMGEIADGFFVILLFVIDAVLQAKFGDASEFFI